jgi:ABC-type transporter Mla subunit MlaD
MSEATLLYVMTAFVIISAIALCIQAVMLGGIYKTAKQLQETINPLVPKVANLVEKANSTLDQSGRQIAEITSKTNDILDSTKRQMAIIEEVVGDAASRAKRQMAVVEDIVGDAASRAKVQMERVELVIDDTLSRAHETVAVVHDGIMKPLREVNGIAAGVRAALGSLARGNRPTPDRATADEEMFI